jgi:glycosyltransferase involved in cell wall biosynthesis
MACGTPVVASLGGALPEVIGNTGRYFYPSVKAELATRFQEVLSDEQLRKQMRSQGLARSRMFSWDHSALAALALFDQLGSKRT